MRKPDKNRKCSQTIGMIKYTHKYGYLNYEHAKQASEEIPNSVLMQTEKDQGYWHYNWVFFGGAPQ